MNPRVLIVLYLGAVLLPLAVSALSGGPAGSVADELGAGAGMLAYAVLLAEFLLSGRFRTVSRRIGIDVTMRFHQLLARTAVVLALVHPFAYATPSMHMHVSALATGIVAWVLLGILVLMALLRDRTALGYGGWRLTHGVGAALISGLLLHHALYAGSHARDPVMVVVWIALFSIAAFSLVHIYVVRPILKRRAPWAVDTVRRVALKTWEVTLAPVGHDGPGYRAGQFAWITIGRSPASPDENPFSIASAPAEGNRLRFIIKELGDFTRTIGRIAPGTRAYVDGPHGNLTLEGRDAPGIALLAGGVGIAPILGILRQLHLEGDTRPTVLIYGNRCAGQIVHRDELDRLAAEHGTRVTHVLYEPDEGWEGQTGLCDASLIRREFDRPGMRDWTYVLCGPKIMMDIAEHTLIEIGVPAGNILSERFQYD